MRFLALVTVLAVLGCSAEGGGRAHSTIPIDNDFKLPNQEKAENLVREYFGADPYIHVYWTTTCCPHREDDLTAVVYQNRCYHGLTFSCDEIYVAKRETIGHSSLVHELGHCIKIYNGVDGDGEHSDTEWWTQIRELNVEVRKNGW